MKKKYVEHILTAVLLLGCLFGCANNTSSSGMGSSIDASASASAASVDISDKKIGICIYQMEDYYMSKYSDELVSYLVSCGISNSNIEMCDSYNNKYVQINQVKAFLEKGVDALIINPVDPDAAKSITTLASDADVPVVYINREPDASEEAKWEDYDLNVTYVGCDARQSGIYQGELILAQELETLDLNGDGVLQYYMIEGDPNNVDANYRTEYSVKVLRNAGWTIQCSFDAVGNWNKDNAKQLVYKALEEKKEAEVIICNNDAMALGAIEAVEEYGLTPGKDVFVVGVDALEETLGKIQSGEMLGSVFNDYITQSHAAGDVTINYLKGLKSDHFIGCEYIKTTKENAEEILEMIK